MEKQLVVITGCDSGIGKSLCETYLKNGYAVAASFLYNSTINSSHDFFQKKMDLRLTEDIKAFYNFALSILQKGFSLSHFINNAGVAVFGPAENLPIAAYRETFDINYFGMVALVKDFIPHLISSRGTIIVIGSTAGKVATPFSSPYCSSKFAVEGFCDSLRRELIPHRIKTILIEPAGIQTPIWKTGWENARQKYFRHFDKKYLKSFEIMEKKVILNPAGRLSQEKCAEKIYRISLKKHPKARYMIAKNYLTEWLKLHVPSPIIDFALPKILGMDYGKKKPQI
ncbi:MAG: SDR family NAD(P)-dependent oxidoreductase [Candidatus Goldbacteria bacterium]|nr:SDR family NAD(P)-dependent oxidoreductase [Candidatus Goldiibacteriota bacterium]